MKIQKQDLAREIRMRLADSGGLTAQELGFGRIPGQVLVYLYLFDGECPLERIEQDLGLSKAAASIAARQLESLGLLRRVYKNGERKSYYRTADNLGQALQQGVLGLLQRKMDAIAGELDQICRELKDRSDTSDPELRFLDVRVHRAKVLRDRASKILNSRLLRFLAR